MVYNYLSGHNCAGNAAGPHQRGHHTASRRGQLGRGQHPAPTGRPGAGGIPPRGSGSATTPRTTGCTTQKWYPMRSVKPPQRPKCAGADTLTSSQTFWPVFVSTCRVGCYSWSRTACRCVRIMRWPEVRSWCAHPNVRKSDACRYPGAKDIPTGSVQFQPELIFRSRRAAIGLQTARRW
jgi:hypothetical protein